MPIIKHHNLFKNGVTILPNELAQNEVLSYEAKGVLLELTSRPENWVVHKSQLERPHTGVHKLTRIFKELQEHGYLYCETIRSEDNTKIEDRQWIVSVEPMPEEILQCYGKKGTSTTRTRMKPASPLKQGFSCTKESMDKEKPSLQKKDILKKKEIYKQNKIFFEFASSLSKIIQSSKNIHHPKTTISKWMKEIQRLHTINKVEIPRIQSAIDWYSGNAGGEYVPVVESGKSFRSKFTKLEDAMKRDSTLTGKKSSYQPPLPEPKNREELEFRTDIKKFAEDNEIYPSGNGAFDALARCGYEVYHWWEGINSNLSEQQALRTPGPYGLYKEFYRWWKNESWIKYEFTPEQFRPNQKTFQKFIKEHNKSCNNFSWETGRHFN